jgi:hypothetical protein
MIYCFHLWLAITSMYSTIGKPNHTKIYSNRAQGSGDLIGQINLGIIKLVERRRGFMSKSYIINFFESIARILLIGCSRITIGFDRLPQANMLGKHSTKNLADLIQHTGQ